MNYIVYGETKVSKQIFNRIRSNFNNDEIVKVKTDAEMDEAIKIIKFRPFFNNQWLLDVNLDRLDKEHYLTAIKQLTNPKVICYYRLPRNVDRYTSIVKSKTMTALEDLLILNAKFPPKTYVADMLLKGVKKVFDDAVIDYVHRELRFNIDEIYNVIDNMNDYELDEITLKDIKIILPKSKTKDIKGFCYCILLSHRGELKSRWREKDSKILVSHAGVKKKPYSILEEIDMQPEYLLKFICDILKNMVKVRRLYAEGTLTETNVFKNKDKMARQYPFLENLTVPTIRDYIMVSREITLGEIQYCLNEFLFLRQKAELTIDDIFLVTYKLMNRHGTQQTKMNIS